MQPGERQVAETVDGIRADHTARYLWAADRLRQLGAKTVVDVACGVGYGAKILADAGFRVTAFDVNAEAIAHARKHFDHPSIVWGVGDAAQMAVGFHDAAVVFEAIEHVPNPGQVLERLRGCVEHLFVSVPNEAVFPYRPQIAFHFRHYRRVELETLLRERGFSPRECFTQADTAAPVVYGENGRTILIEAVRSPIPRAMDRVPESVALVGMGDSKSTFVAAAGVHGGARALYEEVWAINCMAGVIRCDRIFHMDDLMVQEARAAAGNETIKHMLELLRGHPGPIYTSKAYPDKYPGSVPFPIEDLIAKFGHAYFNSTVAYAVAHASFLGVKRLGLYGIDFSYAGHHSREKGRGCVEFWLGFASARGMMIQVAENSTLLDANVPEAERFYGYDAEHITVDDSGERPIVRRTPRDKLPSAAEMEARYDHSK
ncbi:MAG TPA: class I SAM-dependent methyltransferase [Burkholderiales bacterium]|nr:class I SAM-dependent methyltransferase [Burkholderiales bacterium]